MGTASDLIIIGFGFGFGCCLFFAGMAAGRDKTYRKAGVLTVLAIIFYLAGVFATTAHADQMAPLPLLNISGS